MYSVALLVAMVASYLSLNLLSLIHFLIFIKSCDVFVHKVYTNLKPVTPDLC